MSKSFFKSELIL